MAIQPIKLSEVKDDQMLIVKAFNWEDGVVVSKARYMNSSEYLDRNKGEYEKGFPKVYLADKEVECFSLRNVFESMEDDKYEGWLEDVWSEIKEEVAVDSLEDVINKVLERHPTYWDGREVDTES